MANGKSCWKWDLYIFYLTMLAVFISLIVILLLNQKSTSHLLLIHSRNQNYMLYDALITKKLVKTIGSTWFHTKAFKQLLVFDIDLINRRFTEDFLSKLTFNATRTTTIFLMCTNLSPETTHSADTSFTVIWLLKLVIYRLTTEFAVKLIFKDAYMFKLRTL